MIQPMPEMCISEPKGQHGSDPLPHNAGGRMEHLQQGWDVHSLVRVPGTHRVNQRA